VPVVYGVLDERHPEPAGQRRVSAEARALGVFGAFAQDVTEPASLLAGGPTDARSATAACPTAHFGHRDHSDRSIVITAIGGS
jgi:hypothetical protein